VCVYICLYVYSLYVYSVYTCISIDMYVCVYVYIYIHIHIHIHIHTNRYIRSPLSEGGDDDHEVLACKGGFNVFCVLVGWVLMCVCYNIYSYDAVMIAKLYSI
jgi:hypothetical protein